MCYKIEWIGVLLSEMHHNLPFTKIRLGNLSLSSVPWSIRPLTTHDVFIFKVRFLAASHMVRGDVSPVFSITWLRKRSLCPPLAFFPRTLPARMRSSSSPFRMMWPVKRVCLSLMVLRS